MVESEVSQANRWEKCLFGAKKIGTDNLDPCSRVCLKSILFKQADQRPLHGIRQGGSEEADDPGLQTCSRPRNQDSSNTRPGSALSKCWFQPGSSLHPRH